MKFSAIIPAYNVDQYLADCIDSLLSQDIDMEIIIINDGSSDQTGNIAEQYKKGNKNIKVVHQTNSGASVARNKGLDMAQGEYITFIDSDDWITEGILTKLYKIAVESQADMVMGNNSFHCEEESKRNFYDVSSYLKNQTYTGEKCFISLMKAHTYYPMIWNYIYKHEWIKKNNLRFDAGIIHQDEVWTPIALCLADKVVLSDLDFYHYRKREGSTMQSLKSKIHLHALFHIIKRLTLFVAKYEDRMENYELKSWMYVNIYRIMYTAYQIVSILNDSTFILPNNNVVEIYNQVQTFMSLNAKKRCEKYYLMVKASEKKYLEWENNQWNKYISLLSNQELQNIKIILIYNKPEFYNPELLSVDKFPPDYTITFDRKYMGQAYAIVFHLPDLLDHLDYDLDKPNNQVWVAWSMEYNKNDPWIEDEEFRSLFDIWMIYRETSHVNFTSFEKEGIPINIDLMEKGADPFIVLCNVLNRCDLFEIGKD